MSVAIQITMHELLLMNAQIFTWLIEASQKNDSLDRDRLWLDGDALLAIIAGRLASSD